MIISKKALPRRTFLRGMGATVALPLLDAMVPSMTALAKTAANPVRRLGFVYIPMGSHIASWTPPGDTGALTKLSPSLGPLAPVQDQLTVLTNLELRNALSGHARHLQRRVPECGDREVDREQRLLPGYDGRSDRRAADRGRRRSFRRWSWRWT